MSAPPPAPLILVVEDQANHRKVLQGILAAEGYRVLAVKDAAAARAALAEHPALVLSDLKLPGEDGLSLLRGLKASRPGLPVILMTAFGNIPAAVDAMRWGAHDFLTKPLDFAELKRLIAKALAASTREGKEWVMEGGEEGKAIVGKSEAMAAVHRLVRKAGPASATVLLLGETGTGKELVAAAIHAASPRRERPFIKVHCGAIPEDLLEAELFGHEKGAFTGALREKPGKFELADGGTIFLDEVGEMIPAMQVKLLRVLQSGEFDRVGGTATRRADVRVVAATNQDLLRAVADKRFRGDLYYRLNVIPIPIPPLRDRREDIPELVDFFLERHARKNGRAKPALEPEALEALCAARWDGNVRELENVLERVVVLLEGDRVRRQDIP
ncbi:MAG: sigma-54 dependent transcriptional regulator [Elusimicrobia bacterium]|nr:sigma-54 dependent transcriptional regulator [Elusimicrobiota bacterium]